MTHVTTLKALRPILETSLDAGIIINGRGEIVDWNEVASQVFGWSRTEALGHQLGDLILPAEAREAHAAGLQRAVNSDGPTVRKRLTLNGVRRDGQPVPVELSLMSARLRNGERVFIGFARDVTERRQSEELLQQRTRQAELLLKITMQMSETESLEEGFTACLEAVCDISGWEVGHVFLVSDSDGRSLPVPTNVWYHARNRLDDFESLQRATANLDYAGADSLPARIIESGEPAWYGSLDDLDEESSYARLEAARESGVASAFAFPVKYRGRVVAILEFFSEVPVAADPDLMNTVSVISEQLGRVFERKRVDELRKTLVEELNHRVKNNLATVQSIAQQTLKASPSPEEFVKAFNARLRALADAHDILNRHRWEDSELVEVIEKTLRPYGVQVDYGGPAVTMAPSYIIAANLIFHELATNAAKYGALSSPNGHVSVRWCFIEKAGKRYVYLVWQESNGPSVVEPTRRGFGTKLIERGARWDLGADVQLKFNPGGLTCEISIPCSDRVHPCVPAQRPAGEIIEFHPASLTQ